MKKIIISVVAGSIVLVGAGCATTPAGVAPSKTSYGTNESQNNPAMQQNIPAAPAAALAPTEKPATETVAPLTVSDKLNFKKPSMEIDVNKHYTATLHTTAGDIVIELAAKATPATANNFVALSRAKFYDGTIFHRTIPGFMIQGGDPNGNGTGGPGYKFNDEPFTGSYSRGTVAMANSGPNTNGSQFFIMHADYPLPPNYVIFGHVVSGLDAVDKIATAPTLAGGEGSTPVSPVVVKSVDVMEK